MRYLEGIIDYCNEQGIKLVLVKVSVSEWTELSHESVALFAEHLDLLDYDDCTVLISAKGESADGLSGHAREKLSELGLAKLLSLTTANHMSAC